MAGWKIAIIAPNGAQADFVFAGKSTDAMTKQFANLVDSMIDHDPDPLAGIEHTAPLTQPRKEAVGSR